MPDEIISGSSRRLLPRLFLVVVLALLCNFNAAAADGRGFTDEAQRDFQRGAFSQAAEKFQKALEYYQRHKDPEGEIRSAIALADAYQAIGQQKRSVQVLEAALARAESTQVQTQIMLVQSRLGAALTMTREPERAASLLNEALNGARAERNSKLEASILNDQGNLLIARQNYSEALTLYDASAALARQSGNLLLTAQALCNAAAAAARTGEPGRAEETNGRALEEIGRIEPSYTKASLLLTAGQTDRQIKATDAESARRLMLRAHSSFQQALELAGRLPSDAIEAYALGYLAQLYEKDGQSDAALDLTRRAIFAAQKAQMPEALYRWDWQEGRLLKAEGSNQLAIAAYRRAVQTLDPIRNDVSLSYGNSGSQQSFREAQGPLFFELADLLLLEARSATEPKKEQALLREARDTVEHLKTVELNDYFCDDCVDLQRSKTRDLEAIDEKTAVIYLIPLPSRTEVLVGLSSGLKRFTVDIGAEALAAEVTQFRRNLETRTTYGYLAEARQLYDWLIRPLRPWLSEHHVDTLVVVPDGALRTIPFASLHDGERFLIQDLAVAVAPGLSLVAPPTAGRGKVRLLLSGLSESVQGFPALDFVPAEMRDLEALYPTEKLYNENFTLDKLSKKLEHDQYSIVHIASHGQFSRDVRNTFVLTHDTKLTLNILESLIRPSQYRGQPVELLVLSACQTAAGDDRAALGLAGVAVKAGARSALASLWFVNDQSTSALVAEVHRQLQSSPSISKAHALQAAQIKLLNDRRYHHPCYWSPFLIIGNWL